ncbi:MAG: hypothetical protein A3K19_02685 [Lentisphaerae bacterium RIFOXYB12_FULL_65_16]|nr:MAG: hypothetical protein A3K18_10125 [Lentisphaerae bacterium RIFOXYA12_64_32]OGV92256.1 MAG: hypothetical protein A3K19_02685 [Lentisphaerae bacterium RIFOXYB12_FULL_65_16]
MKTWLKRLVGVAVVVQAGVAWAGESPWTLRLGVSYRDFDDVDFKGGEFRNWGTQNNTVGPYGVQNATTAPGLSFPDPSPVILDYVRSSGSSEEVDNSDKFAPIIGFRYDLTPECKLGLGVVGNLQYYRLDIGAGTMSGTAVAPGGFSVEQYQHWPIDASPGTLTPGAPLVGPAMPGTTFSARNQLDMDLYVLDIGLDVRATVDRVNFTLAAGPTLTIADAESSQKQQASWEEQGGSPGVGLPAGSYTDKSSDSDTDFLLGAYAALGVTLDVTTSWSVGVEYRYDYVSEDAGTRQAELDLSGSSGILRVGYRF